jgi:predicted TIM-barrel fold metal-dependent hydrolase
MSYPWPYRRIGADNIMFAIDHPYQTTEAAVRFLDEAEISDEDRRKIHHRNAERIFGIPDCEEPTDVEY